MLRTIIDRMLDRAEELERLEVLAGEELERVRVFCRPAPWPIINGERCYPWAEDMPAALIGRVIA